MTALPDASLDQLFRTARSVFFWSTDPPPPSTIQDLYELARLGPTSTNCCPARFVWVISPEAKERLKPHLAPQNVQKTMDAPLTAIIAYDPTFYTKMNKLFPIRPDAGDFYGKDEALANETAVRNAALQGAYLMIAARALGLDAGPMSGFEPAGVEKEFLAEHGWRAHWLCNFGYKKMDNPFPRLPRLDFDEANVVL